ncbi:MAG: hypothetical protein DHS20C17_16630 [Cyclobacteriaceae bacterium]|nr:MAG: hypothetical protein DHS20C17_16630 [Cyclobacteriaceae bacterium]
MKITNMNRFGLFWLMVILLSPGLSYAQWIEIDDLHVEREKNASNENQVVIRYSIKSSSLSENNPAYVFVRYCLKGDKEWNLLKKDQIAGNGLGIISKAGSHKVTIKDLDLNQIDLSNLEISIRAMEVVRIPGGEFELRAVPGGGHHETLTEAGTRMVSTFYISKYETTLSMYTDFLNEVGGSRERWSPAMSHQNTCGILRTGTAPHFSYQAMAGRENHPVTSVSWFSAKAFLNWCGLRLPSEAEWEKATVGGLYLDGDKTKKIQNPLPDRTYAWGNQDPNTGSIFRCNMDGDDDGYAYTAPVGSFPLDKSPYGVYDLAGNVAEWTLDFYTNRFLGDNGYRILRGGSWVAFPEGVDGISQATSQPFKASTMVGFRGVAEGESEH